MFSQSIPSTVPEDVIKHLSDPHTIFIDVRSPAEYDSGHAQGAQNMPIDSLTEDAIQRLKQYDAVYVICQSAGRSSIATKALGAAGVKAINVSGGTSAWSGSGLPMK
jgi:rhodanese-related sulfurtransferase